MGDTDSTTPLLPGSLFGGYAVEALLGTGAAGAVYRAVQISLRRPVALKILKSRWRVDAEWRGRFQREGRLAARITAPGVVKVLDVGQVEDVPYIAYELIQGTTLRNVLALHGRLTPQESLATAAACAEALAAIHEAGILHRDVKPDNIFIDEQKGVLLGDLGCSKDLSGNAPETTVGRVLGTPAYLAPELLQGGSPSVACDLWALGVVLFECLTGRRPFCGKDSGETMYMAVVLPLPSVAAEIREWAAVLDPILARMLAKEPGERYPDARAVAESIQELLRRRSGQRSDPTPGSR
ncbi:MAG: serine/threonine protein kinase, partial [Candidatus Riflebacteria bacterium]|nr:serine/threonine protein kinase [Candidatus Riflebacteria bacterium]